MSQRTTGLRAVLSSAAVYQGVQDLLGARGFQRRFVREFVRPPGGTQLLDIGCGTAALLEHLPDDVGYHGFDLSDRYIAAARTRWGARGQFWRASVADAPRLTGARFARATAVNADGLFVRTTAPEPAGTALRLRVPCDDGSTIELEGVVAWSNPAGPTAIDPGMGVRFIGASARARRQLMAQIGRIAYLDPAVAAQSE